MRKSKFRMDGIENFLTVIGYFASGSQFLSIRSVIIDVTQCLGARIDRSSVHNFPPPTYTGIPEEKRIKFKEN